MLHVGVNFIDGVPVEVERKRTRRINLRVSPDGCIRLSVPERIATLKEGEAFLRSKWRWAVKARADALAAPSTARRPASAAELAALDATLDALNREWCGRLGEQGVAWRVREMRTMWGSCHFARRTIAYSRDLARVPRDLVEYVVVHELTHFRAHDHGPAFRALMDARLPDWQDRRRRLNRRQRQRLYVDLDDILCETAAHLCELAAREFGRRVAYEDVYQFDLQGVFGLDDAQMRRFMELSHEPASLLAHAVTPGAPEALRALRAAGHEVEIVTGRPASAHAATEAWLEAAGLGGFPVVYVDKYGRDACYPHRPDDPRTATMAELAARRYDVVVEDSPNVFAELAGWRRARVLVFDRPWNRDAALAPNMQRVRDWGGILGVFGLEAAAGCGII